MQFAGRPDDNHSLPLAGSAPFLRAFGWFAPLKSTTSGRAWAALYGTVQRHAHMLSCVEPFWVMGIVFLIMLPFVLLLQNPQGKTEEQPRLPPTARLEIVAHEQ